MNDGLRRPPRARPAADFAMAQLHIAVFAALTSVGFTSTSANAHAILVEVARRYMALLARTGARLANDAHRDQATPWDVAEAIEQILGAGAVNELSEWTEEEGIAKRDLTGLYPEPLCAERAHLAELVQGPLSEHIEMRYEPVPSMYAELEIQRAVQEAVDEAYVDGRGDWNDEAVEEVGPESGTKLPISDDASYIPSFLPPLPSLKESGNLDALMEEELSSKRKAEAPPPPPVKREPESETSTNVRVTPRVPLEAPDAIRSAEVGHDGVRRVWRRRANHYVGTTDGASRAELPSIAAFGTRHSSTVTGRGATTSSLDAFSHAMDELLQDTTSRMPVYLSSLVHSHMNPSSNAFITSSYKRRRLAHSIADPLRFVPNDSLHGCVDVRPVSPAAAPTPSLLITIPPGADEQTAAPIFTPVHPQGRAVALSPPGGAQFPTLAYRHPAQLYTGARLVMYPDMQRVFSRLSDPPALLDDHHTEQVYHGMAANRALLTGTMMSVRHRDTVSVMVSRYRGANSILHASLERLRFHLAAQHEAQRRAAKEGGLEEVEEPIRGERVKMPVQGTLVHSWDWPSAEPFEASE